jgi:hypothetical protein
MSVDHQHETATAVRLALHRRGYCPLPLQGGRPVLKDWQKHLQTNAEEIELWERMWPHAQDTGVLCSSTTFLTFSVRDPDVARAIEALISERFDGHPVLTRYGTAHAIPFQSAGVLAGAGITLIAPDGGEDRIGFLANGHCCPVHEAEQANSWHGATPWEVTHDDLPGITIETEQQLLNDIAALLIGDFGRRCKDESSTPPPDASKLVDRSELQRFFELMFRHADRESYFSVRVFSNDRKGKPLGIAGIKINAPDLIERVAKAAEFAARAAPPGGVLAPVTGATFSNKDHATFADVANGQCIAVELDKGNTDEALQLLESIIGPATCVVLSGGTADGGSPRRHAYWRLTKPTRELDEHNILELARRDAALLTGADGTGSSIVHPYRWPGSVHTKNLMHPVRCRIERNNAEAEVDLQEAAQKLADAVAARGLGGMGGEWQEDFEAPVELSDLASALAAIDIENMSHADWIAIGMSLHNWSGGSADGLALFDAFCRRSPGEYDRAGLERQWRSFARKPPGKPLRTAATIFWYAQQHGWEFPATEPAHDAGPHESERQAGKPHNDGPHADGGWPEPDMAVLKLHRRDAPRLPIEVFGERWARSIESCAAAAACPADYVVAPLMAAASALIGHARWPRAGKTWTEPPHLWCASVGDSGDGKSPGADVFYRQILPEIERRMTIDFPDRLREAQVAIEIAKAKHDNWKAAVREADKAGRPPPSPPPPIPELPVAPRLVLSDITIEEVAAQLACAAPKGVLMHRDELTGWFLGMTAYNDGARPFWLETFGGRPYRVDRRKHPEPIIVPRLAVSWHGGIQPQRLAEVMHEADDGLLSRFLWFWPEPVTFLIADKPPDTELAVIAFDRLRTLKMSADDGAPRPLTVPLTDAAVRRLEKFGQLLQERKEGAGGLLRSAIGKARGLALRLSLVLEHLYWCAEDNPTPPDVIREETLLAAAKFVIEYAMAMAERCYGDASCAELDRNTATLARWIAKERPDAVHVRHLQREVHLPGLREAKEIHAGCKSLIEAGWLGPAPGRGGQQRGREAYPVSPRLEAALNALRRAQQ